MIHSKEIRSDGVIKKGLNLLSRQLTSECLSRVSFENSPSVFALIKGDVIDRFRPDIMERLWPWQLQHIQHDAIVVRIDSIIASTSSSFPIRGLTAVHISALASENPAKAAEAKAALIKAIKLTNAIEFGDLHPSLFSNIIEWDLLVELSKYEAIDRSNPIAGFRYVQYEIFSKVYQNRHVNRSFPSEEEFKKMYNLALSTVFAEDFEDLDFMLLTHFKYTVEILSPRLGTDGNLENDLNASHRVYDLHVGKVRRSSPALNEFVLAFQPLKPNISKRFNDGFWMSKHGWISQYLFIVVF